MSTTRNMVAELCDVLGQALIALKSEPGDVLIDGRYTMRSTIIERAEKTLLRAAAEPEAKACDANCDGCPSCWPMP